MTLLEANPSLALGFLNVHELSRGGDAAMKADLTDLASKETPAKIEGSLSGYATLLLQDYQRSLRTMGPHDPRYVARLGDEARLQDLLARVQRRRWRLTVRLTLQGNERLFGEVVAAWDR